MSYAHPPIVIINERKIAMTKYLLSRLVRGLCSILVVIAIVMVLIYSCLDKNMIFKLDSNWTKMKSNAKISYQMQQWEKYGYLDYIPYSDWLKELLKSGVIVSFNSVIPQEMTILRSRPMYKNLKNIMNQKAMNSKEKMPIN